LKSLILHTKNQAKILIRTYFRVIIKLLPPPILAQKGGTLHGQHFCFFFVAVAAGVACHYIIKWLDGDK